LLIGGLNTLVGYLLGIGLYYLLSSQLHILLIAAAANVLAISFSFCTYKLLVFRTRSNWLAEYRRSYVVYGGMALLSTVLLWALVDGLQQPIWLAQALAVGLTVFVSYLGHSRYTFRPAQDAKSGRSR